MSTKPISLNLRGGPRFNARIINSIVVTFVVLGIFYSVVNPIFEAPDEVWHYEYVRWLVEGNGLPAPEDIGIAPWRQEGSQPPLYYLLAAGLVSFISTDHADTMIRYNPHNTIGNADAPDNHNAMVHGPWEAWPWRDVVLSVHIVRLFSVLLGVITIIFTYRIGLLIAPTDKVVPVIAASLVAFNPQFIFVSSSVSNDVLVTACATVALWWLLRIVTRTIHVKPLEQKQQHPTTPTLGEMALLGLLFGILSLSKLNGLALWIVAGLILSGLAWKLRSFTALVKWSAILLSVAAPVALWWYWRNWQLFDDPLALSVKFLALPGRTEPLTFTEILTLIPGIWRSMWAVFGWFNVVVDERLYAWYTLLCLVGLLSFIIKFIYSLLRKQIQQRKVGSNQAYEAATTDIILIILVSWVLLTFGLVLWWGKIDYPQGRLAFPALSALMILVAYGYAELFLLTNRSNLLSGLLVIPTLLFAFAIPWLWIMPAYQSTPPEKLQSYQNSNIRFGDQLLLLDYDMSIEQKAGQDQIDVTLYWQALTPIHQDYSIFIHATDQFGILQGQRDSFPDGGNRSTRTWSVAETIIDSYTFRIPAQLPSTTKLRLDIGVYDFQSGNRLPVAGGDFYTLGYLTPGTNANGEIATEYSNFEDQIALVAYSIDKSLVHVGEQLKISLEWEALKNLSQNYVVFIHLLLPSDGVWAQSDSEPMSGQSPTSTWQRNQQIQDEYTITIPSNAPSGIYRVEVGLYEPESGARLKVGLSDAGIVIGQISVVDVDNTQ